MCHCLECAHLPTPRARCRCGAPGSLRRARPGDASDSLASAQTVWRATPPPAPPLTTSRSMGHRETWPISNRFRNWLRRLHRQKTRTEMSVDFFKQVIFWTKPTIFWTRLCAYTASGGKPRRSPATKRGAAGGGGSTPPQCVGASQHRSCAQGASSWGLGKVSTSGQ
jgi:hypothetical protein